MQLDDATETMLVRVSVEPVRSAGATLTVLEGPNAGAAHRIDELANRRVLIGSSAVVDVRIEDRSVSRRHAALELGEEGLRLLDLGSRNGTTVNGVLVRDVSLRSGDTFIVGKTKVRIDLDDQTHLVDASPEVRFGRTIGVSASMRRLYPVFQRLTTLPTPILIEGEPGTGKELLAECIHEAGPRAEGPFVSFEPAAHPPSELEALLFGTPSAPGAFQQASGGTLFIDEVADLPMNVQLKLLRAVERSAPGGATVRLITATRQDLEREIQERRFREDLFMVISSPRIELPPLRKRTGDIALLTRCLWVALGGAERELSPDLVQYLERQPWPGNVRGLHAFVARTLSTGEAPRNDRVSLTANEDVISNVIARDLAYPRARQVVLQEFERRYTEAMLEKHGGRVGQAAAASGIGRRYFQAIRARR